MIEYLPETGSTNADLAARLRGGELVPEGLWLVADRQTAGRGRRGREWFDGAGNFMGSTVVHLRGGDPPPGSLALVAGLALHAAVEEALRGEHRVTLKWPNDLIVGTAKLAGILLEREGDAVIVGIGVNLAAAPQLPDRATVSLAGLGAKVGRDAFSNSLVGHFALDLARWRSHGLAPIVNRWLAAGHPVGTLLSVGDAGEELIQGTFAGLADDGALQLRLPDGTTKVIHSGEVHFTST